MARRTGPAPGPDGQPGDPGRRQEEPEGYLLGVPYDWRKPSNARSRARSWNPDDRRMFPPKAFGWGYERELLLGVPPGAVRDRQFLNAG